MNGWQFHEMVHHQSGCSGFPKSAPTCATCSPGKPRTSRAAEAVALFCYRRQEMDRPHNTAALGGWTRSSSLRRQLGENAFQVRARICDGLQFLGLRLDPKRKRAGAPVISTRASRCQPRHPHGRGSNYRERLSAVCSGFPKIYQRPRPAPPLDAGSTRASFPVELPAAPHEKSSCNISRSGA